MTFLAPAYLYAAIAVALATVALHFIATREPRAVLLPTARFVPAAETHALVRTSHFSDPWLLALRVLLVLLIGAALARPVRLPQRERVARVILADLSAAVASGAEVRDSVRALFRPGDAVVAFDSSARQSLAPDSLGARAPHAGGSLSTALVRAHAAASRIRAGTDSIELVVVSPLSPAELDRASARIRGAWPGRARLVPVSVATARAANPAVVTWTTNARPPRAIVRQVVDTVGAVVAGNDVVVAPFARRWTYASDSLRGAAVVARWEDGEPAAIEWDTPGPDGDACTRSVAIPVDSTGDLVLRPEFVRLRARLLGTCGAPAAVVSSVASMSVASMIAGTGALAPAGAFPAVRSTASTIAPWLFAAALVVAVAELVVRRRRSGAAS